MITEVEKTLNNKNNNNNNINDNQELQKVQLKLEKKKETEYLKGHAICNLKYVYIKL